MDFSTMGQVAVAMITQVGLRILGAIILSVVTSSATGLLLSPDWQFTLKGIVTFIAILAQRFALDKRKN